MARRRTARVVVLACTLCVACSGYIRQSERLRESLLDQDYAGALEVVEKIDKTNSLLLYYYERGLVLHYENAYVESNDAFEKAEALLEDLYTKSVVRELVALTVTEGFSQYRGDAFEAVLVNYYKILNYLYLGDVDGAAVECRRISRKLQMLQDGGESYFENDPFLQYMTAMVYEAAGDAPDAEVSYRVAVATYDTLQTLYHVEAPAFLFCDAAANARRVGDVEAVATFAQRAECERPPSGFGRVNVLLEGGFVVHKDESNIVLPIFESDRWEDNDDFANEVALRRNVAYENRPRVKYWLKISMPVLIPTPVPFQGARVRPVRRDGVDISDAAAQRTFLVENIDALAEHAFAEKEFKILVRAIVRALVKYNLQQKVDKEDRTLGALVNIFNIATETADTRSWTSLPEKIMMARLDLAPGTYDLEVELIAREGTHHEGISHERFVITDVVVDRDRTAFVSYRVH